MFIQLLHCLFWVCLTLRGRFRVGTDELEWSPGQLSRQRPVVCLEFGTPVVKVVTTKSRSLFRGLGEDLWHACETIIFFEIFHNFQKKGKKIIRSHACCHRSSPNPLNRLRDFVVTTFTTGVPNSKHTTGLCRDNCRRLHSHSSVPTFRIKHVLLKPR